MRELPPIAWSTLCALALCKAALHLPSNGPLAYGLMTDELYYLDCARHLAWGYVDHPPLSIALLRASIELFGTSEQVIRSGVVLATTATLVLAGLMAREMGGGRIAQSLAAGVVLASPVHLSMGGFYSMNPIDMALWAGAFWLLIRLANGADRELWLALGVVLGLCMQNKLSALFLGAGLASGLIFTPQRRLLATRWPWLALAIALAMQAPQLIWQLQYGWPTAEFLAHHAGAKELVRTSPLAFLGSQLVATGVPLWLVGLAYLALSRRTAELRHLAWTVAVVVALFALSGSAKIYYPAPVYSVAFAAAGVAFERARERRALRWAPAVAAAALAISGAVLAPFVITLLSPERLVDYQRRLGLAEVTVDETERAPLHQGFAQMFHGRAVAQAVALAYHALPPHERERVVILTHQFGETGGINHYGPALGLPRAVGTQGSYWLWGPGERRGDLVLEVADDAEELASRCESVARAAPIDCPYCMPSLTRKSIYLCRGADLRAAWPLLKRYE